MACLQRIVHRLGSLRRLDQQSLHQQFSRSYQHRVHISKYLCMSEKPYMLKNNVHNSSQLNGIFEDNQTKELTVWSNIKQVRTSPVPALAFGLSGLIPFVAVPSYMMMNQIFLQDLAFAQVAYGATILAFIGGVRWGFTIPEENPVAPDLMNLGYSVMPSLIAWTGLLLPHPFSLFTMMGGLTLSGYLDMAMYGYPPWFKGLRFILSFVAVLSLWTTFMCGLLLEKPKPIEK